MFEEMMEIHASVQSIKGLKPLIQGIIYVEFI